MTLLKESKIPTQHVTARYLGRAYPKGGPKKNKSRGSLLSLKVWPKLFDGGVSGDEGYLIARMFSVVILSSQGRINIY